MSPLDARITVAEVWHLALPPGTTLAGGRGGLQRHIEWVASLRTAFPLFGALGKGYLALARLGLAQRVDSRVTPAYLVEELHRAQAVALVVDEPISAQAAALADRLGLPVLVLPSDTDLHEVERDILRTLVDHEGQLARRETEVRHRMQQLLGHGGIPAVVNELARLTSGEVHVTTAAQGKHNGHENWSASAATSSQPTRAEASTFPIRVAGRALGQLLLRTRTAQDNPLDTAYARQAAEVCGIELLQRLARQETEERLGADLVELLLAPALDQEVVASRLHRLGHDAAPGRSHLVVALNAASQGQGELPCDAVARDLQWAAQREEATTAVVRYKDALVVFCSYASQPPGVAFGVRLGDDHGPLTLDLPASAKDARLAWLRQVLSSEMAQRCPAGVSRPADRLSRLGAAVSQALDALELGRRIAISQDAHSRLKSPYYYEELGLYRLLAGLRDRDEIRQFYEETLGALARYDRVHGTELVRTLEVFFGENTNASQTSKALYIHRNTLSYRLQRIVDITGLDLNDAGVRLAFQVALQVHRLGFGQSL